MESLMPIVIYLNNTYLGINEIVKEFMALVLIVDIDDWAGDLFETYCKTYHPYYREGIVGLDEDSKQANQNKAGKKEPVQYLCFESNPETLKIAYIHTIVVLTIPCLLAVC